MTDKPKPKNIRELVNTLNKKLGTDAIKLASEIEGTYFLRRPSGIFSLDLATGGGLPAGTMVKIGGAEGLGKNYLADCYLAECQRIYGNDAHISVVTSEYPYDKLRGRDNGVRVALTPGEISDLEKSLKRTLSKEEKKELASQTGEILLTQGLSMEESLQVILDSLESDLFHIILVDSMDALLPQVQEDRDLGNPKLGASAIVQTDFMKKFYRAIGRARKTLLLTLGQARANIPTAGARVFKQSKVNDPYAVKHGLAGKIVLSPGGPLRESKRQVGKIINWQIEKGKAGFHDGPTGVLNYYYATGVDKMADFVESAKSYVEQKGAFFYLPNPESVDGEKLRFHGLDELKEYFCTHTDTIDYYKNHIYQTRKIACIHHEDETKASRRTRKKAGKKARGKNNP
jgi:RecA/RadA recombinase